MVLGELCWVFFFWVYCGFYLVLFVSAVDPLSLAMHRVLARKRYRELYCACSRILYSFHVSML